MATDTFRSHQRLLVNWMCIITGRACFREKNLSGRDREMKGERESSWVGGKHLVVVEAWPWHRGEIAASQFQDRLPPVFTRPLSCADLSECDRLSAVVQYVTQRRSTLVLQTDLFKSAVYFFIHTLSLIPDVHGFHCTKSWEQLSGTELQPVLHNSLLTSYVSTPFPNSSDSIYLHLLLNAYCTEQYVLSSRRSVYSKCFVFVSS